MYTIYTYLLFQGPRAQHTKHSRDKEMEDMSFADCSVTPDPDPAPLLEFLNWILLLIG